MDSQDMVTLAAIGAGVFMFTKVMGSFSGPGETLAGVGGWIGGIAGGIGNAVNSTLGGASDILDRLNPFTSGPIFGWF